MFIVTKKCNIYLSWQCVIVFCSTVFVLLSGRCQTTWWSEYERRTTPSSHRRSLSTTPHSGYRTSRQGYATSMHLCKFAKDPGPALNITVFQIHQSTHKNRNLVVPNALLEIKQHSDRFTQTMANIKKTQFSLRCRLHGLCILCPGPGRPDHHGGHVPGPRPRRSMSGETDWVCLRALSLSNSMSSDVVSVNSHCITRLYTPAFKATISCRLGIIRSNEHFAGPPISQYLKSAHQWKDKHRLGQT